MLPRLLKTGGDQNLEWYVSVESEMSPKGMHLAMILDRTSSIHAKSVMPLLIFLKACKYTDQKVIEILKIVITVESDKKRDSY